MEQLKKYSNIIIIGLSIIIGLLFKQLSKEFQIFIEIPMCIFLIVYGLLTFEHLHSKIVFILISALGFIYLLAIYINSGLIDDIVIFTMTGLMLLILIIPIIKEYKINKKLASNKLSIVAIITLIMMMLLFVGSKIYVYVVMY